MLLTRQSPTLTDKRSLNARESATRVQRGEISLSLRRDICYPAWKAPALSRSTKELPKTKLSCEKKVEVFVFFLFSEILCVCFGSSLPHLM